MALFFSPFFLFRGGGGGRCGEGHKVKTLSGLLSELPENTYSKATKYLHLEFWRSPDLYFYLILARLRKILSTKINATSLYSSRLYNTNPLASRLSRGEPSLFYLVGVSRTMPPVLRPPLRSQPASAESWAPTAASSVMRPHLRRPGPRIPLIARTPLRPQHQRPLLASVAFPRPPLVIARPSPRARFFSTVS